MYAVSDGLYDSEFSWSVEGGTIIQGEGTDTVIIQWGHNVDNYRIEVVEISKDGCIGTAQVAFVQVMAPDVNLGFDYIDLCEGENILLDASGDYFEPVEYLWHDGSGNSIYSASTTEIVWVRVTDSMGCFRYDSVDVDLHPLPKVDLGNDTVLCNEEEPLTLNAGIAASYEWSSTQGIDYHDNPLYLFPSELLIDTISVEVSTIYNCTASDTLILFPCDIAGVFIDMVNTFSPDGDGINEKWNIDHVELFPDAVLEIFDRWGRLVYHTEDVANEPWDGKSNGKVLPMDSYYFVLELNYGGVKPITGTVNIIK